VIDIISAVSVRERDKPLRE